MKGFVKNVLSNCWKTILSVKWCQ